MSWYYAVNQHEVGHTEIWPCFHWESCWFPFSISNTLHWIQLISPSIMNDWYIFSFFVFIDFCRQTTNVHMHTVCLCYDSWYIVGTILQLSYHFSLSSSSSRDDSFTHFWKENLWTCCCAVFPTPKLRETQTGRQESLRRLQLLLGCYHIQSKRLHTQSILYYSVIL